MNRPKIILIFLFWVLFGFLSTFFAEALSGSAPDFFFTSFGYFGIFPIYALHSLLLASLVIGRQKPFSLRTLYLTSLLFGMYEAYITKVLWEPPWNANAFRIANVAVVETNLLVFFWHSIFSFILPLFWIEGLALSTHQLSTLLPEKWRKRLVSFRGAGLTGMLGGILAGSSIGNPDDAIVIMLANCLIISLMFAMWKLITRKRSYKLANLLPRKGSAIVLGILLAIDYLIFGLQLRREVQPGFIGQAAVLVLYAAIGLSIFLSMRKDQRQLEQQHNSPARSYTWKHWLIFCLSLCVSTVLVNLIPANFKELITGAILLIATGSGIILLAVSIIYLFRTKPSTRKKIFDL